MEGVIVSVRLKPELLAEIDAEAPYIAQERPDEAVSRGVAIRALIRAGLEARKSKRAK